MSSNISSLILRAKQKPITKNLATQIFSLIDLTSLNNSDTNETIISLCKNAQFHLDHVAAICVYPQFISLAKQLIKNNLIKIATVVNFPEGTQSLEKTITEIKQALADGADEIDVVFPYTAFLNDQREFARNYISQCKSICGAHVTLKVILETGELKSDQNIANASVDAINSGADFLKTSTGKTSVGATLEAAFIMLNAIKKASSEGKVLGFKAAGGVKTLSDAAPYIYLAQEVMGKEWISPQTFRFGASSLVTNIINEENLNTNAY